MMKKLSFLACILVLSGCMQRLSHEEQRAVTDACHKVGLEYYVRGDLVQCWKEKP